MPRKCTITGPEPLYLRLRKALRFGIAILICLTALDTAATPVRQFKICLAEPGVTQLATRLALLTAGGAPSSHVFEDHRPQPVLHALRIVSGLVARTSHQSKAVVVRMATIIGFRG